MAAVRRRVNSMQRFLPDLGEWPQLEWEQWKDTAETLPYVLAGRRQGRPGLTPIKNHLAVTRFNGKRAPARPGVDQVQADAYSHEVISVGFGPGNGGYGGAHSGWPSKYGVQRRGRI
jgi:hypothetical protein